MIAEPNAGFVHKKVKVRRIGDRVSFRIALPARARELVSVECGTVPGPAAAGDLGGAPFGQDCMGRLTLRMNAPGEVFFQEHLRLRPWREENYSPLGMAGPSPIGFNPRAGAAAPVKWPLRSRQLLGLFTDLANERTGVAEPYELWIRIGWRKGGPQ